MTIFYISAPTDPELLVRPLVYALFDQICDNFGLPKNRQIIYKEMVAQASSLVNSTGDKSALKAYAALLANLPSRPSYTIEVEERVTPEGLNSSGVSSENNPYLFYDNVSGLKVKLNTLYTDYVLRITMVSPSLSELRGIRDYITAKQSMGQMQYDHQAQYNGLMMPVLGAIFKEVASRMLPTDAGVVDYVQYLQSIASPLIAGFSDINGQMTDYGFSITHPSITGTLLDNALIEPIERNDETATYVISFEYQFAVDKPVGFFVHYPIIINNQLLPNHWIKGNKPTGMIQPYITGNVGDIAMGELLSLRNHYQNKHVDYLIRIPDIDYIVLTQPTPFYAYPLQLLIQLDDASTLFSMKQLGEYEMDPDIVAFLLESEAAFVGTALDSFFHLALSQNEKMLAVNALHLSNSGDVALTVAKVPLKRNRVHLGICLDLSRLTPAALLRLRLWLINHPELFWRLLGILNYLLSVIPGARNNNGGFYTKDTLRNIIKLPNTRDKPWSSDPGAKERDKNTISTKTVVFSGLIARRK